MNKITISSIIVAVLIIISGGIIFQYVSTTTSVDISMNDNVTTSFYQITGDEEETLIKTIDSSGTISLRDGEYCAQIDLEGYDTTPQCFTVEKNLTSLHIDQNYSPNKLQTLLSNELLSIETLINQTYAPVIASFTLKTGELFGRGEWYGATLTQIPLDPSERGDTYRLLLKKEDEAWKVIAYPQLVLSKQNYPNVPFSVLSQTNKLVGEY